MIKFQIQFESVVSPGPEFKITCLDIERKVGDVDGASAFEYRWRNPEDRSKIVHHDHRISVFLQPVVGAFQLNFVKSEIILLQFNNIIFWKLLIPKPKKATINS